MPLLAKFSMRVACPTLLKCFISTFDKFDSAISIEPRQQILQHQHRCFTRHAAGVGDLRLITARFNFNDDNNDAGLAREKRCTHDMPVVSFLRVMSSLIMNDSFGSRVEWMIVFEAAPALHLHHAPAVVLNGAAPHEPFAELGLFH